MTTLAEEMAEQKRWKLRPEHSRLRLFDELVENEFRPVEDQRARLRAALRRVVGFAVANVPYYTELFCALGLRASDIDGPEDLAKLPTLTKNDVIDRQAALHARSLPRGEQVFGYFESSGTTWRKTRVLHTANSNVMFTFLRQRNARWFRLDPAKPRVGVLCADDAARRPDGSYNPDGVLLKSPAWRHLGLFFETGSEYTYNLSNPMARQLEWLRELRPAYAMSDPTVFEHWLDACGERPPVEGLETLIAISSQLTPMIRRRLDAAFALPIRRPYGLNEIGCVGAECLAGRYHVHAEHCLLEIVGDDGRPTPPGRIGHVLVTGLRNLAMPLIRYETGDLAQALAGPCPCGRTLPSFGEITGRFRRFTGLPEGTRQRFEALRDFLGDYPLDQLAFMRRYQVHQDRQDRFTLRLKTTGPIPEAFAQAVRQAWAPVADTPPRPLTIERVEQIPPSPSGKIVDFMSDLLTYT